MSSSTSGGSSGGSGRQPARTPMQTISEASRPKPRTGTPIEEIIGKKKTVTVEDRLAGMSDIERRQATQLGRADAPRVMAIQELTERLADPDPISKSSTLAGAVSRVNLENQIKQLRDFGTPVFDTDTGKTVGVINKRGQYSGDAAFQDAAMKQKKGSSIELSGTDVLQETRLASKEGRQPTKVATEEEEVAVQAATALGAAGRGRGTRGKRFGAGGTILEGTGALYE